MAMDEYTEKVTRALEETIAEELALFPGITREEAIALLVDGLSRDEEMFDELSAFILSRVAKCDPNSWVYKTFYENNPKRKDRIVN